MMTINPLLSLSHGFIVFLIFVVFFFFSFSVFFFFFFFFLSQPNRSQTSPETKRQKPLPSASHITSSASSSSSSSHSTYDVFPSFCGGDVRRTFLSHVHKEFQRKGIITFKDNGIKRCRSIGPELIQAIQESRIAIVVLSKNYASSSWCLNELLEIMKCRKANGQRVMTVFHKVDPSDVRKQTGEFGKAFKKACVGKSSEEKQRWKNALREVANIAGEHSEKWYLTLYGFQCICLNVEILGL